MCYSCKILRSPYDSLNKRVDTTCELMHVCDLDLDPVPVNVPEDQAWTCRDRSRTDLGHGS